jgi:hypothetical protein
MQRVSRATLLALSCLLLASLVVTQGPAGAVASSLTPENRMLGWRGDKVTGSVRDPSGCGFEKQSVGESKCTSYYFSVNIPGDYWSAQRGSLGIKIRWIDRDDDFDLYIYRADRLIKSSRQRRSTSESVSLKNPKPGTYRAIVVPFRVTDSGYGGFARLRVAPPPPETRYYAVPTSIRSDCSRDVTSALLRWIGRVPNNATLSFSRGGCYRIDKRLSIVDRWGLTFQGNGATFKAVTEGRSTRAHFFFLGGGNLAIRNLTVIGANPNAGLDLDAFRETLQWQHAFSLNGVQGAVLDNVRASDVFGDFVFLGEDTRNVRIWSKDVTVQNSTFERNGRQGITIFGANGVTVRWNWLGEVRMTTFDLEVAAHLGALNVEIANNVTGRGLQPWFVSSGSGFNVANVHVVRNLMIFDSGIPLVAVETPRGGWRGPFYFADNDLVVRESPRAAFEFTRASEVHVANNTATFLLRNRMTAVLLQESRGVQVTGNHFYGAARIVRADLDSEYFESDNET